MHCFLQSKDDQSCLSLLIKIAWHAHYVSTEIMHRYHHYIILILLLSIRLSVRPESITGSYLTPVKKVTLFASLSFDITEAIARKGSRPTLDRHVGLTPLAW